MRHLLLHRQGIGDKIQMPDRRALRRVAVTITNRLPNRQVLL